MLQKALL